MKRKWIYVGAYTVLGVAAYWFGYEFTSGVLVTSAAFHILPAEVDI